MSTDWNLVCQTHSRLDAAQQIFYDADKWGCPNSQTNKQENVILLIVLSWGSIGSLDEDTWKSAKKVKTVFYTR